VTGRLGDPGRPNGHYAIVAGLVSGARSRERAPVLATTRGINSGNPRVVLSRAGGEAPACGVAWVIVGR